ncbi:hypothetical protein MMC22_000914 [Lobaria immixta]|nr:hypothetical protein [Lobaria immixta]
MSDLEIRYTFGGTDAVIHIAEEMRNPERKIPQAMNLTMAIGFMTAFPLSLVMILSMKDIDAVLKSQLPYAEIFYQITGSKAVTTIVLCWASLVMFSALIGQWVTCGRLAWAFARDRGIPYSSYFAHISERHGFPLRTTLLSLGFCSAYGLLYLFNTTAFNSIITSVVVYLNITYAVPQILILLRGRANVLPRSRPFDLGRLGHACNLLSPLLVIIMSAFNCLPPHLPVTSRNANYTPVVLVGLFGAILAVWFSPVGQGFEGPRIDWEVLGDVKIT